jgi:hypothetical protein
MSILQIPPRDATQEGECHRPTTTPRQIIHIQRTIGAKLVIKDIDGDYFAVDGRCKLVVNHKNNVMHVGTFMLPPLALDDTTHLLSVSLGATFQP